MSAHLTIAITIAFAMIVNARIVVARSASMLPSEMMKNMEAERLQNKMTYEEYQRYMEGWPYGKEYEQGPMVPGFIPAYEKPHYDQQLSNHLDDQFKSEEYPEPLPEPQALNNGIKMPSYKKSGSQGYHMTICHFKICNMGRKRDTHNQKF